jgi:two-component system, cell cycle response regulator
MKSEEPCRILIVDDDWTLVSLLSTVLSKEGYGVRTSTTGHEALDAFPTYSPNVVLLDVTLPDMSGLDVMNQMLKVIRPSVILMTDDDSPHCHGCEGAADILVKPVRLSELVHRIRQAVGLRRLTDAHCRLAAELERQSIRDELTGLFNQRFFETQLNIEVQRALRYRRPVSLIVYNIDDFSGDSGADDLVAREQVLAGVSRSLSESVRSTDSVFHCEGGEFAVVLPETQSDQAILVADRTRKAVTSSDVMKSRRVTVSCGIAELRQSDHSKDLVLRADAALSMAKRTGRSRVEVA